MRRIAISLAVIASLLAPVQALAAVGLGCEGVRPVSSCCCPLSARADEDAPPAPAFEGVCCCEIQPVAPTARGEIASAPPSESLAPARAAVELGTAEPPIAPRAVSSPEHARPPPLPAGSLLSQHIALLL
jgi:hypothetical protein